MEESDTEENGKKKVPFDVNPPFDSVDNTAAKAPKGKPENKKQIFLKADPCLKKILRAFRREIKDHFVALYGKKYNHWSGKVARAKDKAFFTSGVTRVGRDGRTIVHGYQFEEDFYERNEAIFFSLINHTKKDSDMSSIGIRPVSLTKTM